MTEDSGSYKVIIKMFYFESKRFEGGVNIDRDEILDVRVDIGVDKNKLIGAEISKRKTTDDYIVRS